MRADPSAGKKAVPMVPMKAASKAQWRAEMTVGKKADQMVLKRAATKARRRVGSWAG